MTTGRQVTVVCCLLLLWTAGVAAHDLSAANNAFVRGLEGGWAAAGWGAGGNFLHVIRAACPVVVVVVLGTLRNV